MDHNLPPFVTLNHIRKSKTCHFCLSLCIFFNYWEQQSKNCGLLTTKIIKMNLMTVFVWNVHDSMFDSLCFSTSFFTLSHVEDKAGRSLASTDETGRTRSSNNRLPPEGSGGRRNKSDYLWELQGNISAYPAVIWLTEQARRARRAGGGGKQWERWLPRRVQVCRRWRCATRRFILKNVHNVQPIHVT